jgi:hypothetical protein
MTRIQEGESHRLHRFSQILCVLLQPDRGSLLLPHPLSRGRKPELRKGKPQITQIFTDFMRVTPVGSRITFANTSALTRTHPGIKKGKATDYTDFHRFYACYFSRIADHFCYHIRSHAGASR